MCEATLTIVLPEFGSPDHALLAELQHLICQGYVHIARIIDLTEAKNSLPPDGSDFAELDRGQRLSALDRIEEEAGALLPSGYRATTGSWTAASPQRVD